MTLLTALVVYSQTLRRFEGKIGNLVETSGVVTF
jgi:hypothetical protein